MCKLRLLFWGLARAKGQANQEQGCPLEIFLEISLKLSLELSLELPRQLFGACTEEDFDMGGVVYIVWVGGWVLCRSLQNCATWLSKRVLRT